MSCGQVRRTCGHRELYTLVKPAEEPVEEC